MKAKIYQLSANKILKINIPPAIKFLHYEIICASFAKGTSVIKNVNYSKNILCTIDWCRQMGAIIQEYKNHLVIHGTNNQFHITNNVFATETSRYTFLYMLPLLSLTNQLVVLKNNNREIIESAEPYRHIFEKCNSVYNVERNTIKMEQPLSNENNIYINGYNNTSLIAGLLLALPTMLTTSKIIICYPYDNREDILQYINILKKFGIIVNEDTSDHSLTIPAGQTFKACNITTDNDYYLASLFSILKPYAGNVQLKGLSKQAVSSDFNLLSTLKNNNIDLYKLSISNLKKKKPILLTQIKADVTKNSLPLFMGLAIANELTIRIKDIDKNNIYFARQLNILKNILKTLDCEYEETEKDIIIHGHLPNAKKQVDSENDPYFAIVLSLLGILTSYPIIVKNCSCVDYIWDDFYGLLKSLGVLIEFIHD